MDKEMLKALLAEIRAEEAPVVTVKRRVYVKNSERIATLLQELTEADVAYKEALETRKQAEATASATRARIEELLVESRKYKVPQRELGAALNISVGSVSSRMATARKAVRKRNRNK